mmetsp:Transcript_16865/g.48647  ORF Transcript_16865/g.48647 Transcript_16865/m.48647 type:complete len:236 (+) Transcript_16865:905-1612(+)
MQREEEGSRGRGQGRRRRRRSRLPDLLLHPHIVPRGRIPRVSQHERSTSKDARRAQGMDEGGRYLFEEDADFSGPLRSTLDQRVGVQPGKVAREESAAGGGRCLPRRQGGGAGVGGEGGRGGGQGVRFRRRDGQGRRRRGQGRGRQGEGGSVPLHGLPRREEDVTGDAARTEGRRGYGSQEDEASARGDGGGAAVCHRRHRPAVQDEEGHRYRGGREGRRGKGLRCRRRGRGRGE